MVQSASRRKKNPDRIGRVNKKLALALCWAVSGCRLENGLVLRFTRGGTVRPGRTRHERKDILPGFGTSRPPFTGFYFGTKLLICQPCSILSAYTQPAGTTTTSSVLASSIITPSCTPRQKTETLEERSLIKYTLLVIRYNKYNANELFYFN